MRKALLFLLFLPIIGYAQSDILDSEVSFEVDNLWVNTVEGSFGEVRGKAVFSKSNPEQSIFDLSVEASTVDTGNEKRDEHLRTEDFFDVENHPAITISSTNISEIDDSTYRLEGSITIKGISKSFETDFRVVETKGDQVTLSSDFNIAREDFDLGESYGGFVIADEIDVSVVLVISS